MKSLAIDCGGSHVGCGVVEGGTVLARSTIETDARSLSELLPELRSRLQTLCRAVGIMPRECRGVGIGFPGIIDPRNGQILSTLGKFADVTAHDLAKWSDAQFQLQIKIENDAKLALLGEHSGGAARGFSDVVMVTLGTGIGGAVMIHNRLLWSEFGQAGSLGGHLTVKHEGRRCACGAVGCAEAEASTSVLSAIARERTNFADSSLAQADPLDFAAVFRCKDAGDTVAREVLDYCVSVWSALTVALIHAYGPQLILFGGGIMNRGSEILPAIRAYVAEHAWSTSRGLPKIETAALGNDAALVGAEVLLMGTPS